MIPRNRMNVRTKTKTITFPDPVAQAQIVFSGTPDERVQAYDAKQSFLQSSCDNKNMLSGIDFGNQRLFQSVTDTMRKSSLPAIMNNMVNNQADMKQFLSSIKLMSEQPEFTEIMYKAIPMLLDIIKKVKNEPELKTIVDTLANRLSQPNQYANIKATPLTT